MYLCLTYITPSFTIFYHDNEHLTEAPIEAIKAAIKMINMLSTEEEKSYKQQYLNTKAEYDKLKSEYEDIVLKHKALDIMKTEYDELHAKYMSLNINHKTQEG